MNLDHRDNELAAMKCGLAGAKMSLPVIEAGAAEALVLPIFPILGLTDI